MSESRSVLTTEEMAAAWKRRDASFDGLFVFGVKTTGIFCRPSCPSRPRVENIEFFDSAGKAVRAGYRPCKRCQPELANGKPPEWVAKLMARACETNDRRIGAADLRALGIAPERARRWFQRNYGMTFATWQRGLRLSTAYTQIRRGEPLDNVILGNGFESHSGFRSAFAKTFGSTPRGASECLKVALLDTPLGAMLAGVNDRAVVLLEFADRRGLERSYADMKKRFGMAAVPGENEVTRQLRTELAEYFAGERERFSVPCELRGTQFQERVWRELMCIQPGTTRSYTEVARLVGKPGAVRAVARANATNRLYLLVPCHRVIGHDGQLSGYGGGLARKKQLLQLEARLLAEASSRR